VEEPNPILRRAREVFIHLGSFLKRRARSAGLILSLAGRKFLNDQCPIRAAALSYTALISLVPIGILFLTLFYGYERFRNYGYEIRDLLIKQVLPSTAEEQIKTVKKVMDTYVDNLSKQIEETSVPVSAISFGVLLITAMLLFAAIEKTFNDLWGVKIARSPLRRLRNFWVIMTLGPVFIFLSYYLAQMVKGKIAEEGTFSFLLILFTAVLPYILSVLAFYLLYQFSPYTSVKPEAALTGALFAGIIWELLKRPLSIYLTDVLSIEQIYGPIALVPIFLIWLFFTWALVLFGAEVVYSIQNKHLLKDWTKSISLKRFSAYYAIKVVETIADAFKRGKAPLSVSSIAKRLTIPRSLALELAQKLADAKILLPSSKTNFFSLSRPANSITLAEVVSSTLEERLITPASVASGKIGRVLAEAENASKDRLKDITVEDILTDSDDVEA